MLRFIGVLIRLAYEVFVAALLFELGRQLGAAWLRRRRTTD